MMSITIHYARFDTFLQRIPSDYVQKLVSFILGYELPHRKLRGIKPYRFRIVLQMIRVICVICEICGLKTGYLGWQVVSIINN